MRTKLVKQFLMIAVATAPLVGLSGFAIAQDSDDDADEARRLSTIIVESRKKEENLQDVPVVVQAFDSETLENFATYRMPDIADLTSGLSITRDTAVFPSANIRGIQGNSVNPRQDEPVSINFDGIPHSNSGILFWGLFDVEAVEVLKGPQALYFGKNSPGGIISIRTKDPTDEFFTEFQAGYEFEAERKYGYGIISGPLSENWGARLAVNAASQEGYFNNTWGQGDPSVQQPFEPKGPQYDEYLGIGTLQGSFERTDITLKVMHGNRDGGQYSIVEATSCNSVQDNNPFTDCTLDGNFATAPFSGNGFTPSVNDRDKPTTEFEATQVSLDIVHELSDDWTVESLTGFYDSRFFYLGNVGDRNAEIAGGLGAAQDVNVEMLTQELRLSGSFEGWNVTLGAFADDRSVDGTGTLWLGPLKLSPDGYTDVSSNSWSVFAQADFDFYENFNLSVGGRYTEEELSQEGFNLDSAPLGVPGPYLLDPSELSYDNFSPEVTLSWMPQDNLNFFISYREGFKSGGFNASILDTSVTTLTGVPIDDSYREELVEGFEIGAKTELFDNTLRFNSAIFSYEYSDLQQAQVLPAAGGGITTRTVNAAVAQVRGFETDVAWITPVEGLDLTANLAYNDNEFQDYISACNDFQQFFDATGCNVDVDNNVATDAGGLLAGTGFDAQDRTGDPLRRAPEWSGSVGLNYQRPISNNLNFIATSRAIYTGEYQSNGLDDPRGIQDAFWLLNGSIGVSAENNGWSLELIGRNLTDEITFATSADADPGAPPLGEPPNFGGAANAPMQVFVQFTVRPQALFGK
ncbi:MAG: TonB-dependent receptor [Henriciella sp.]